MKTLKEFILEAKIPIFSDDERGVREFCEYVFDPGIVKYIINPDLTITLESLTPSFNIYMDTKDLVEIPEFIIFSNIEKYNIGLNNSKCKIKCWTPRVNGYCKGIIVNNTPKVQELDLSNCEIRGGMLDVEMSGIKSIIGAHGEDVRVFIKKNKNLEKIHLNRIKSCKHGSWITNNKNLLIDPSDIPHGIRVENNKLKEKIYIS